MARATASTASSKLPRDDSIRGQLPQPVRVQLVGQVQAGVGRVEIALTAPAVGIAGHLNRSEHGLQRPDMTGLDTTVLAALDADHLSQARLACRPQVQVVLVEQADQLPQIHGQPLFVPSPFDIATGTVLHPAPPTIAISDLPSLL